MKSIFSNRILVFVFAAILSVIWIQVAYAEELPKVSRKVLLKQAMTIPEKEAVILAVDIQPGAEEGRHTHPAELYAVVQEGALILEVEGMDNQTFKAGDAFFVAPGKIHNVKNVGTVTTKLNAFLVAEKGKPLSSPAK